MSKNATTTEVLEVIETPDLAELDEATSHGMMKGILIAVGVAVIAAAIATIVSKRQD